MPASLLSVKFDIRIAGQRIHKTFSPAVNQSFTFVWDGRDGFGRPVYGQAEAHIRLAYHYGCVYYSGNNGFGQFASAAVVLGSRSRCQGFDFPRKSTVLLKSPFSATKTTGNWSLSVDHRLDGHILLRGDGSLRYLSNSIITTVAGAGVAGYSGDGGPATEARLNSPEGIAIGPDGSLYIASSGNYLAGTGNDVIRRVAPNGIITTVAGTGIRGYSGDGGPAIDANLSEPSDVAIGPDGSLYIASYSNNVIRKVAPNGIITTVAGSMDGFDEVPLLRWRTASQGGKPPWPFGYRSCLRWYLVYCRHLGLQDLQGFSKWYYYQDSG